MKEKQNLLEEGTKFSPDFSKLQTFADKDLQVLPVVVQDFDTKKVLMLGYLNEEALKKSLEQKRVVLWSTSRKKLWIKGATSGNYLKLNEARINCEQNSFLFLATPQGTGTCHTRNEENTHRESCFYRKLLSDFSLKMIRD